MPSIKRRGLSAARLLAHSVLLFIAVDYACFLRRAVRPREPAGDIIDRDAERAVDARTMGLIGWVDAKKASSFTRFNREKPKGTIRIGCFGSSFVYGAEVDERSDYPSRLQALFNRSGHRNVEVINFGGTGYGFHQTYMMWNLVGRHYGLDYVVVGPRSFNSIYDATFGGTLTPLHARYVLRDGDVRLVEPLGDSTEERASQYHSFIPRLRYLAYDIYAPAFLTCLLPAGRVIRNPFYYRPFDIEDEIHDIDDILLSRMRGAGSTVLLIRMEDEWNPKEPRFRLSADGLDHFPYTAPRGHVNAEGNEELAGRLFAFFSGAKQRHSRLMKTSAPLGAPSENASCVSRPPDYSDVRFTLGQGVTGRFVDARGRDLADAAKGGSVKSLLFLRMSGSPMDGRLAALPFSLRGDEAVNALPAHWPGLARRLAAVAPLDRSCGVWTVALPPAAGTSLFPQTDVRASPMHRAELVLFSPETGQTVKVGGLLSPRMFTPQIGRADDLNRLGASGNIDLLISPQGASVPIARWTWTDAPRSSDQGVAAWR